jgi:hypothetical protein
MTTDETRIVKKHITWALLAVSRNVNRELAPELVGLERSLRSALQTIAAIDDGVGPDDSTTAISVHRAARRALKSSQLGAA